MCNAKNHPTDCRCGWGGDGHRGKREAQWNDDWQESLPTATWHISDSDFCRIAKCPRCSKSVYFVRHNGGSAWFDDLGKPWPKHPCFTTEPTDNRGQNHYFEAIIIITGLKNGSICPKGFVPANDIDPDEMLNKLDSNTFLEEKNVKDNPPLRLIDLDENKLRNSVRLMWKKSASRIDKSFGAIGILRKIDANTKNLIAENIDEVVLRHIDIQAVQRKIDRKRDLKSAEDTRLALIETNARIKARNKKIKKI